MAKKEELFVNCPIPMTALIASLSDKKLEDLHSAMWTEMNTRINKKVKDGTLPSLLEEEKQLTADGSSIRAVKAYHARTKLNLMTSKRVVDYFMGRL